jgi:hypothetical protein
MNQVPHWEPTVQNLVSRYLCVPAGYQHKKYFKQTLRLTINDIFEYIHVTHALKTGNLEAHARTQTQNKSSHCVYFCSLVCLSVYANECTLVINMNVNINMT